MTPNLDGSKPIFLQKPEFFCLHSAVLTMFQIKSAKQIKPQWLYLRSRSLGWFLLSRLRSMRSDSRCLRMSVAYSSRPWSAVMISEATYPRSRMEKERCSSSVRMNVSRKTLLFTNWANCFKAFSTQAWPLPDTLEHNGKPSLKQSSRKFRAEKQRFLWKPRKTLNKWSSGSAGRHVDGELTCRCAHFLVGHFHLPPHPPPFSSTKRGLWLFCWPRNMSAASIWKSDFSSWDKRTS